ncbi:uncharacterized protein PV09_04612 [Verruconis gallopava]|uniref:Zn(2)-C6 fungal-type domain-containing protein n=1 Tax=Verruconis gallopava TaxID=253628 RepID=A0A0D2ACY6_9PEZI|nr:uncharacterized protein PV09_04612 [Verruconis gallopava]KIW04320.1 hypothetical protein PV09_04612 [Verruconis gallopava]
MPPRLAHTKSRKGCVRCKARKVKCDESRPICKNCSRHNVACEWRHQDPAASANAVRLVKRPVSRNDDEYDLFTPCLVGERRRQLELQLLHYFESHITWTLGSTRSLSHREIWACTAVELSFRYPFLQNAIFAFAALYAAKSTSESRRFFASGDQQSLASKAINHAPEINSSVPIHFVHEIYLDLALRQQRDAVKHVTVETADAVLLSTMLHWYQATSQLSGDKGAANSSYELPTQWLRMAQANRHIAAVCRELRPKEQGVWEVYCNEWSDFETLCELDGVHICDAAQRLLDFESYPEPKDSPPMSNLATPDCSSFTKPRPRDVKVTYTRFLAYVANVHQAIRSKKSVRHIFRLLGVIQPSEIIVLIEEKRPRALAILSLYFSLCYALNGHWVWQGVAEQQLEGIANLLPQDWQWAMAWPRAVLQKLKEEFCCLEWGIF